MGIDFVKNIVSFFRSRKLAIVLILLIMVFSLVGIQIPQKSQIKPEIYNAWEKTHPVQAEIFYYAGFTHLFSSFLFISLVALLFANTFFCTWSMVANSFKRSKSYKQFKKPLLTGNLEKNKVIETGKNNKDIFSVIYLVLTSKGYNVQRKENQIFAEKNRMGVFGTPLFHVSILFIILAAVYGSTGRMEGDMRLIEGQTLAEDHSNYMFINEGPFFYENHQKFDISLEKFFADYIDEAGTPRGATGKLAIIKNGQMIKTDVVYSNHQMNFEGYTFLGNVYGLAPLMILRNPDGSVYSGSFITATDEDESERYVSYFQIGDTGLEGGLMVYMTAPLTTNITESVGIEKTPILFLKLFENGKEINDVTMKLNDTIKIGDKTLGFYDIKYWSNFYVVKDNSIFLIYAGFGIMILSLFISFFIVPGRIFFEIVDTGGLKEIHMKGKSDKFKSLFEEELSSIINDLKKRLKNDTG